MRIISQDGTIDVPYEQVVLISLNKKIYLFNSNLITDSQVLAEYLTEEKAYKAMEMLRNEYGKHYLGQGGAMATANFYVPAFGFIPPKVFQFPKDDEIEV